MSDDIKQYSVSQLFSGDVDYLIPMYQQKMAYGTKGFPWTSDICKRDVSYDKGICPIAEKFNDQSYLGLGLCAFDYDEDDIDSIIRSFHKVWANMDVIANINGATI